MQIPEQRRVTHPVRQISDIGRGWEDAIRTLWTGNITPRRTNGGIEIVVPVLIKLVVQHLVMEAVVYETRDLHRQIPGIDHRGSIDCMPHVVLCSRENIAVHL